MQAAGIAAVELAQWLWENRDLDRQEIAGLLNDAAYSAHETAHALGDATGAQLEEVGRALKNVFGQGLPEVIETLQTIAEITPDMVAGLGKEIGFAAGAIIRWYILFEIDVPTIATHLIQAGFSVAETAAAFADELELDGDEIASALRKAGATAAAVGQALRDLGNTLVDATRSLRLAGFSLNAVGDWVRTQSASFGAAVGTMRQAGYTAGQAAAWLDHAGQSVSGAFAAMAAGGFGASAAAAAIDAVFNPSATQMMAGLRNSFGQTASQAVSIMKNLGFGIVPIFNALQTVYGLTQAAAIDVLLEFYSVAQLLDAGIL